MFKYCPVFSVQKYGSFSKTVQVFQQLRFKTMLTGVHKNQQAHMIHRQQITVACNCVTIFAPPLHVKAKVVSKKTTSSESECKKKKQDSFMIYKKKTEYKLLGET